MNTRKKTAAGRSIARNPRNWPPKSVLNPGDSHLWQRTVVFDFHEVCVSWMTQFAKFINASISGAHVDPEKLRYYCAGYDPGIGLGPDDFERAFAQFSRLSKGGYGDLAPVPGIKETMDAIVAAGIKIEIWTWTPGVGDSQFTGGRGYKTGIAQRVTRDLIKKLELPVNPVTGVRFMTAGNKALEMGREHIPLIVEDSPMTAVAVGLGIAHAAILVPTGYGKSLKCDNVLPLNDRNELAPAVISFYQKLDEAGKLL